MNLDSFRLRRLSWPRIILYVIVIGLLVHISLYFVHNIPTTTNSSLLKAYHDFPWYTKPHLRPPTSTEQFTTTHLTVNERRLLREEQVNTAEEKVKRAFPDMNGIRGSLFDENGERTQKFRDLVDCWTTGQWVKVKTDRIGPLVTHFQDPYYGSCDRKFKKTHDEGELREAVHYAWKTQCPMLPVDSSRWCQAIRGRHILLVGDLVHYQLHDLFLDTLRDGPAVCFGELNCKDHTLCSDPHPYTRLRYLRNDLLSVRRRIDLNHGTPRTDVIEWPFTSSNTLRTYSILILNRAPVRETDEEFMDGLINTLKVLRKGNPNALILYRSTSIGHPYCDDATEPLKEPISEEQERHLPFGWSEISRRNAIARTIIEGAGGLFIDLGSLTDLRPDGHIGGQDCSRYCFPGPLDTWAQIFYNVFLGLDDQ
ncbi:hypothetical protein BDB01DRAFT_801066 [Pilobolus umbonatus]|nr:hypothetical protein BDB01DRAFT_801066 [Pilobolus umbonatus]